MLTSDVFTNKNRRSTVLFTPEILRMFLILLFSCFFSITTVFAYDSDGDGYTTMADALSSISESRLKETVHTLLVLSGSTPSNDVYFSRSPSGNIVEDLETGLSWQDTSPRFKTEDEGILHCNGFELDGHSDWRLPTFEELQTFFQRVDMDTSFDLRYWGTFSGCTASVAIGGYVKTPVGAERYGGEVGDRINFIGGAAARCVRNGQ